MNLKKIVEFSPQGKSPFCDHLKSLSESHGWGLEFDLYSRFEYALLKKYNIAKVDTSMSKEVIKLCPMVSTVSRSTQCVDTILNKESRWYPEAFCFEVLRKALLEKAKDVDIKNPAFVLGASEKAGVAAAVLADLGFRTVYISDPDIFEIVQLVALLNRSYFSVDFKMITAEQLTEQTMNVSVLINTLDLDQNQILMSNISYFNFMGQNSFAVDFFIDTRIHSFTEEAQNAGLRTISSSYMVAELTKMWLESLQIQSLLKVEDLKESWENFLK